jgi:hypothetical protein
MFLNSEFLVHMLFVFIARSSKAGTDGQLPDLRSFSSFITICVMRVLYRYTTFDVGLWRHHAS